MNTLFKLLTITLLSIVLLGILCTGVFVITVATIEANKSPNQKLFEAQWLRAYGTVPPPDVMSKFLENERRPYPSDKKVSKQK